MTDYEWAVPGSAPSSPTPTPSPSIGAPAEPDRRRDGDEVPQPVAMRPQGLVDLLDAGFAIIRGRPGLVLSVSAVFVTPVALVAGFLQRDLFDGGSFVEALSDPSVYASSDTQWDAAVVSLVGGSIAQTFVAAGIALVLSRWYADSDVEIGEVLGWLLRRSPVVLAAWLLAHGLQLVGLVALLIGWPIAATLTLVVAPVLGIEGGGPVNALRRSIALVRRRFGICLVFFFVSGLMGGIVAFTLSALPTGIGFVIGLDGGWIAVALGDMAGGTLSTAFVAAATVALYVDLRIRAEGLDLDLALIEAFDPERDPRR